MDDSHVLAQLEFENAYKAYTEASNKVYNATTQEEKQKAQEIFDKASERFNLAYQKFKEAEATVDTMPS